MADRQKAYKCDVVYLTNAELGFDYLRDNLAVYPHQVVQSHLLHKSWGVMQGEKKRDRQTGPDQTRPEQNRQTDRNVYREIYI